MPAFGYSNVPDRAFVAFEHELDDNAWKDVDTSAYEAPAKENPALLLTSPLPVVWKLRMRWGVANVVSALGATSLVTLDDAWDAAQRRLFHHIAIGVDSDNAATRAAADRARAQLLSGIGTAQTQLSCDDEVDFGRQQITLTQAGGPLEADAKKLKLGDALADVQKTTEALAVALGRGTKDKRKAPSKQLRDALSDCAGAFNSVHEQLTWFLANTPKGAEHDRLTALLAPLEGLLERAASGNAPPAAAPAEPAAVPDGRG